MRRLKGWLNLRIKMTKELTMQKNTLIPFIVIITLVTQSFAQLYMNPRSISLADAYVTQARGSDVIGWNPANLGLSGNPKFNLDFGIIPLVPFPAIQINNNSISPFMLNNYFFTGKYLNDKDKEDLLGFFPNNGLYFNPLMQMRLINMSVKSWAFTLGMEVTGKVIASKPLFHLALFGNEFGEPIDLSDTDLQMQAVATLGVAHGWQMQNIPFIKDHVDRFAVGVGAKALLGLAYAGFEDLTANVTTYTDKIAATGAVKGKVSLGGVGLALDLGAAADINKRFSTSLTVNNLLGFINWDLGESKVKEYSLEVEIPSSDFDIADSLLEAGIKKDTTYAGGAYQTNYPAYLLLGGEYRIYENLKVMATYRQGFSRDFASTVTPALSIATEYHPLSWLPVRFGIAFGGNEGFKWGLGSGLNFRHWRLDWGFSQIGGFFNHGKGIALSFDQAIIF